MPTRRPGHLPVEQFEIRIDDADVADLRHRLSRTRWPSDLGNESWQYGTELNWLRQLADEWAGGYDWREHESRMNEWDHFRAIAQGQVLHYIHVRRAGALPLLLVGGWPQTSWDFAEVLPRLDGFELVVPDLPGQGFSVPLRGTGIGVTETAALFHELMTEVLGHRRYGVYGTDWGALIGERLAQDHPDIVVGLHTTMPVPLDLSPTNRTRPAWAPDETSRQTAAESQAQSGSGYLHMQSTRPQTIAYLDDSPVAMAAWLLDKIHNWTDHDGDLASAYPRDWLLTTLSIFWFTGSVGTAARFYRETMGRQRVAPPTTAPITSVPTAVAAYPKETGAYPRSWVEANFNLRRYTVMERGGHFPAVESPETLAPDIAAFFNDLVAEGALDSPTEARGAR